MDISLQVVLITTVFWNSYIMAAPRQKRLSLASQMPSYYYTNVDGHPGTYSFGYNILDPDTSNTQFRSEEKYPNGTVVGSYGYIDPIGRARRIDYMADDKGFRILKQVPIRENYISNKQDTISTEATVSWTRPRKNKKKPQKIIKRLSRFLEPPY